MNRIIIVIFILCSIFLISCNSKEEVSIEFNRREEILTITNNTDKEILSFTVEYDYRGYTEYSFFDYIDAKGVKHVTLPDNAQNIKISEIEYADIDVSKQEYLNECRKEIRELTIECIDEYKKTRNLLSDKIERIETLLAEIKINDIYRIFTNKAEAFKKCYMKDEEIINFIKNKPTLIGEKGTELQELSKESYSLSREWLKLNKS